jgi:hypothetical protein
MSYCTLVESTCMKVFETSKRKKVRTTGLESDINRRNICIQGLVCPSFHTVNCMRLKENIFLEMWYSISVWREIATFFISSYFHKCNFTSNCNRRSILWKSKFTSICYVNINSVIKLNTWEALQGHIRVQTCYETFQASSWNLKNLLQLIP